MNILIFGGTTEGRTLAETLARQQIPCTVCVATEYGEQVMPPSEYIEVRQGRLTREQMAELTADGGYTAVVDATHPFATVVSENICSSIRTVPLIRYQRPLEHPELSCCRYFDSAEQCAAALAGTDGPILLTTGSKDLKTFCRQDEVRQRLMVRVLPALESLELCYDAGLEGKQILAMQGPFSQAMNEAQIAEYGIKVVVTKESGKTGGLEEKVLAAAAQHCICCIIRPPRESSGSYIMAHSLEEVFTCLGLTSGLSTPEPSRITLAGIGMGNPDTMTLAVRHAIAEADILFGAPRMLDSVRHLTTAETVTGYLPEDIVPVIRTRIASRPQKIVVLFSGDTGFFSGAARLRNSLGTLDNLQVTVEPGISSLQYLSAKTGISWQDAAIISTHGIPENQWRPQLETALASCRKLFFLCSGAADVRQIARSVPADWQFHLGFQLSYPDEQILILPPADCSALTAGGLYCGFLIPTQKVVQ